MSKSEIIKQLHEFIDKIEDESQLQMLNDAAKVYATKQEEILQKILSNFYRTNHKCS